MHLFLTKSKVEFFMEIEYRKHSFLDFRCSSSIYIE